MMTCDVVKVHYGDHVTFLTVQAILPEFTVLVICSLQYFKFQLRNSSIMISGRFSVQKVYHRYISTDAQNLATFFKERKSVVCITGAGISTESGIPGISVYMLHLLN